MECDREFRAKGEGQESVAGLAQMGDALAHPGGVSLGLAACVIELDGLRGVFDLTGLSLRPGMQHDRVHAQPFADDAAAACVAGQAACSPALGGLQGGPQGREGLRGLAESQAQVPFEYPALYLSLGGPVGLRFVLQEDAARARA